MPNDCEKRYFVIRQDFEGGGGIVGKDINGYATFEEALKHAHGFGYLEDCIIEGRIIWKAYDELKH